MRKLTPKILGLLFIFAFNIHGLSQSHTIPCDTTLWEHVYHAKRLVVIERCKTVTGIIYSRKKEKDGDIHIRLRLDKGQEKLLNEKNNQIQDSCLVIEPICVNEVTQSDAKDACIGFVNQVVIPKKGQHVKVTGTYVLDSQHGWTEIHPITKIDIIE